MSTAFKTPINNTQYGALSEEQNIPTQNQNKNNTTNDTSSIVAQYNNVDKGTPGINTKYDKKIIPIQNFLKKGGYYTWGGNRGIDGRLGKYTQAAIAAYMKQNNIATYNDFLKIATSEQEPVPCNTTPLSQQHLISNTTPENLYNPQQSALVQQFLTAAQQA